ncbi:MAG: hypothetical protein LBO66_06130 [Deltaproteobacteria bacterium]|nr:hypothetical protein [Deltaproteobacteria bacterium]
MINIQVSERPIAPFLSVGSARARANISAIFPDDFQLKAKSFPHNDIVIFGGMVNAKSPEELRYLALAFQKRLGPMSVVIVGALPKPRSLASLMVKIFYGEEVVEKIDVAAFETAFGAEFSKRLSRLFRPDFRLDKMEPLVHAAFARALKKAQGTVF